MKLKTTLIVLTMFFTYGAFAVPMSGTFTIGGTTPDFVTLKAAIDTLFARGVSGAVTFNIRSGTYNERMDIGNIPGTSATNTITFKSENGDSSSVIVQDPSGSPQSNSVLHVYGTDYLTVKSITLYRTGTAATATVVDMALSCHAFRLMNCIVKNDNTSTTGVNNCLVYQAFGGTNDSMITISNNVFENGYYGINLVGQSSTSQIPLLSITNNVFVNQDYRAIQVNRINGLQINNNSITSANTTYNRGISVNRLSGNVEIMSNNLFKINSGDALYVDSAFCDPGNPGKIANNFVHTQGTGSADGITVHRSKNIGVYYNTVHVEATNTTATPLVIQVGDTSINVRNNNLVNSGGGAAYRITANAFHGLVVSDYNNLFVLPNAKIGYVDTAYTLTLADWQTITSFDSHSVSGDPQFVSSFDLHAWSTAVNNNGVVIPGITVDIDGDTRSGSTPDIGADEYTPFTENIGAIGFVLPDNGVCGDSSTVVSVVIRNFGSSSQTGFTIKADITGLNNQTLTEVYNGSLAMNQIDTVTFSQTIITYPGGNDTIKAYTVLANDQYLLNDTTTGYFSFAGHPNTPVIVSPQQQCDNFAQITGTPDSGCVLMWYDSPVGGTLIHTGNVFNPPTLTSDTTFYAEAHIGSGASPCLRITEFEPEDNPSDFLEVQNVSGTAVDATGWKVLVSQSNLYINTINTLAWDLGYFSAGQIKYRSDDSQDSNYWGNGLNWFGTSGGWAMIIDNNKEVVDIVVWNWDSTSINNMRVVWQGDTIDPSAAWNGNGLVACTGNLDNQRVLSDDHDDASDWGCDTSSLGLQNSNMSSVFTHCGIGVCGSPRVPVLVTIVSGANPVNLGNDTIIGLNDTLQLNAGPGYNTYAWNTGDSTQTITIGPGIYWVTVTGGPNNCEYADTIIVNLQVGLNNTFYNDELSLYPNPATSQLVVNARESVIDNAKLTITDLQGRNLELHSVKGLEGERIFDISNLKPGIYLMQIVSGNKVGVRKFTVLR